jgi:hypothetical protein
VGENGHTSLMNTSIMNNDVTVMSGQKKRMVFFGLSPSAKFVDLTEDSSASGGPALMGPEASF